MPYSSIVIANRFIDLAVSEGKQLTNMQLQKLVFLANGFALALLDRPLSYHNVHAWQWGPVYPKLYKAFQKYGSDQIDCPAKTTVNETIPQGDAEDELIKSVWTNYKDLTGGQLSKLTHAPGSPWDVTWKTDQYGIIEPSLISGFYKKQISDAAA